MTNSFGEFADAKMFLCIGTNMTEAHPVAATFLKNALRKGAKLVVVDPRKTPLAKLADIHCQINVGSDIAFLNGLMNVLIAEELYDKDFVKNRCDNFEAFKAKVLEYPVERASEISGVDAETIRKVACLLATVKPAMLCYTLGITEHTTGKDNVISTANLQLLLGNMGMPSAGVNPLRGQNNVQGACDMGALPNVFPGYQKVIDPAMVEKFKKAWNVENLSDRNGIMMPQMMEGLVDKKIRAFYVFGENLANTEPDIHKVEHELASAEFLVCQDIFPTETTRFAHVVFPAAAWSEDDGTFSSSERRVNRVRKVKTPPGNAKPNWWIFKELAKRMGHAWTSSSAQEIWDNEVSVLAPALGGIKYSRIEEDGLQWPCPTMEHPGTQFLHRDGVFTHGKGIFNPVDWKPPAEVPDREYPFVLSTGRRLYQYHTRTQTGRCGLNFLMSEETADISQADAQRLGIQQDEYIKVRSRRGEVKVRAKITPQVPPGMVWMSFHFRDGSANWLTNPVYDPATMTAEYKACAVALERG
jgi:formate dehydrogenase major subunit